MGGQEGPKRRQFSPAYKAEVVALCKTRSISAVVNDLGLTDSAVRRWVAQAAAAEEHEHTGELTTAEREELALLRKENRVLREERDILRRATAFFAKETR